MRKLVLNIAMSLDGFIARKDGSYDWIEGHGTNCYDMINQFDNHAFFQSCDTVVMGRKSLEDCPLEMIEGYHNKRFIIASLGEYQDYDTVHYTNNIVAEIKRLRLEEGSDIWLFGGAEVVQTCLKEQLIDQFIIGIIPTILGEGISLFGTLPSEQKLMLVESTVTDGIAFLRYDIRK